MDERTLRGRTNHAPAPRPDVGLTIRPFRSDDADAVGRITLDAYDAYGTIGGEYRDYLGDPSRRHDDSAALLVAELDGEVVGTVTFVVPGDEGWESPDPAPGDASFRVLAVAPQAEGYGVGRALVSRCIELARERGCHRIIIVSMTWMTRAHELYRSLGFVRRPDLDVRFPGGDGMLFQLDLTDVAPDRFPPPGPVPDRIPWFEDVWGR
jgi:GNAT superfamily N-acetyltransferase